MTRTPAAPKRSSREAVTVTGPSTRAQHEALAHLVRISVEQAAGGQPKAV